MLKISNRFPRLVIAKCDHLTFATGMLDNVEPFPCKRLSGFPDQLAPYAVGGLCCARFVERNDREIKGFVRLDDGSGNGRVELGRGLHRFQGPALFTSSHL